jgi:hypothetical protein
MTECWRCNGTRVISLGPGMVKSCPACSKDPKPRHAPTTQGTGKGPLNPNAKHDRFPDSSLTDSKALPKVTLE